MLAIENTPFDWAIKFSKSGKAIYTWWVMQAYLPHDIEPFYSGPDEYDSRDDWHWPPGAWHGDMDAFTHWRRVYMGWSTEEETRQDEEKRQERTRSPDADPHGVFLYRRFRRALSLRPPVASFFLTFADIVVVFHFVDVFHWMRQRRFPVLYGQQGNDDGRRRRCRGRRRRCRTAVFFLHRRETVFSRNRR